MDKTVYAEVLLEVDVGHPVRLGKVRIGVKSHGVWTSGGASQTFDAFVDVERLEVARALRALAKEYEA